MSPLSHDQVQDLLPAYVLGALERDEEAAVREHLASCQLHLEVAELGGTVHYLAETVDPVEPPAALKARVLAAAAEADLEARRAVAVPAAVAAPAPMRPQPAVVPTVERPRLRLTWGWAMQAAAVIAVIALGAWNLNLQSRVGGLENEVADARAYERALDDVLTVAILPGSQTAVLGPAEGGPRRDPRRRLDRPRDARPRSHGRQRGLRGLGDRRRRRATAGRRVQGWQVRHRHLCECFDTRCARRDPRVDPRAGGRCDDADDADRGPRDRDRADLVAGGSIRRL
jgi:hypothetical protein